MAFTLRPRGQLTVCLDLTLSLDLVDATEINFNLRDTGTRILCVVYDIVCLSWCTLWNIYNNMKHNHMT